MSHVRPPPMPAAVAAAFEAFPAPARDTLLAVRRLIFETAAAMPEVGELAEELRWSEPAYLTPVSGSGSTIRLGVDGSGRPCVFVNCRTTLVTTFREHFSSELDFDGKRAVLLRPGAPPPDAALRQCLALALTYHQRKPKGREPLR